jgi:hypothetical protein
VFVGKPKGKNRLEDLGVDGRIILKLSSRNRFVGLWRDCFHSG